MNISKVPDIKEVYDFMVKFEEESFRRAVEQVINSLFGKIGRGTQNYVKNKLLTQLY